jgi:hypothetical protein
MQAAGRDERVSKISGLRNVRGEKSVRDLIEREYERTGGIFRLAPTWVGRPQIIVPGRRIKLAKDYISQDVAVNERWLASVTYADNGVWNKVCPEDHGLSYLVVGDAKVLLRDAIQACGALLLGKGGTWDVLPKFFDNWHRIPLHLHPCQDHCSAGLVGKPESYYFPEELNVDRNAFPATPMGVDPAFSDRQVMNYLLHYFEGDNRLTDLANTINIIPGTGWFMPPCTLHAPGSLVTYELQAASDVSCIPESRVNDMVMPPDLIDRDIPVKIAKDGFEKVCGYILGMIRCANSGNGENFRREFFRPPARVLDTPDVSQSFVIYRTGKSSQARNPDLYSAKKTVVPAGRSVELVERAAFGAVVLGGHGAVSVPGKHVLPIGSASLYPDRDTLAGDEFFVAAGSAARFTLACGGLDDLRVYQHFASGANADAGALPVPEYLPFP